MDWRAKVEALFRIPDIYLAGLSNKGNQIVYVSNETGSYQLWSLDLQTMRRKQISYGEDRVTSVDVSKDSEVVIFARDKGGNERHQIFLTDSIKGVERRISDLPPIRIMSVKISPNSDMIAFTGADQEANKLFLMKFDGSYETIYQRSTGIFITDWSKNGLITASSWSADEPKVSYLIFYNIPKDSIIVYTPRDGSENLLPVISPDGSRILFMTNAEDYKRYNLAIYDIKNNEIQYLRAKEYGFDFVYYEWFHNKNAVYYIAKKNGETNIYIENLDDGNVMQVNGLKGFISSAKITDDDEYIYITHSSLSSPRSIYKINIRSGDINTILKPDVPNELLNDLSEAKFIKYVSFDGLEIPTYIIESKNAKKPGPSVIWVHGGPWWEVANEWNPSIQALAISGLHVIAPNFRGSTGYGPEFQYMDIGDPGGGDLQDIIYARKHSIEIGLSEPDKIAIAGASYGGFMTYIATVKAPDMWKAAVAIVGIVDWLEMYELSDAAFRSFIERLLAGKPEEKIELYKDRSATNFAEKLKAPLLIWHRANDSRVPLKPVLKYAMKLLDLNKNFELHVVPEEGHGPQRIENMLKQTIYMIEFLRKYLIRDQT
jgi:dipeptidyl aminopeptidase/acylaminoacyl peptidase